MTGPIELPPSCPPAGRPGGELAATAASRLDRLGGPLLTAAAVGALSVALHVRDPHSSGSWGYCPWYALTGYYCPGCGGLRAVNDLTNGDLVGAAGSNLVFVVSIPLLVFLWGRWTRLAWVGPAEQPRTTTVPPRDRSGLWIAVFTVVMLAFAVLRNLPGSWLAP